MKITPTSGENSDQERRKKTSHEGWKVIKGKFSLYCGWVGGGGGVGFWVVRKKVIEDTEWRGTTIGGKGGEGHFFTQKKD